MGEGEQEAQRGLDLALAVDGQLPSSSVYCVVFALPDSGQNLCFMPYVEYCYYTY